MAVNLNSLFPDLYAALNTVSREMTGFIPAVQRDTDVSRAAKGQNVEVPVVGKESSNSISPSTTPPSGTQTSAPSRTISLSNAESVRMEFSGEEIRGLQTQDLSNADDPYADIRQQRIAQAYRDLVSQIESDLVSEAQKASRAYGDAGTTPFGTKDDLDDFAGVSQILDENGAPPTDRQIVVDSNAMFNLRGTQTGILQRANEAGTDAALREGEFGQIQGMALRHTQQSETHTTGSIDATTAKTNSEGDTDVTVAVGSGNGVSLNQGDVIEIANDDSNYVVESDTTISASTDPATITIREPGLQQSTSGSESITLNKSGNDYRVNAGFHMGAMQLATRAPAVPPEGDMAEDRTVVQDPLTGLAFEVAIYPGYKQVMYDLGIVWGAATTKEEHVALLLG